MKFSKKVLKNGLRVVTVPMKDNQTVTVLVLVEAGSKYETKEVNGIFYAMGPNVKKGRKLKPFENIHVYPFVAKILRLRIPEIDGDRKVLENIYKK